MRALGFTGVQLGPQGLTTRDNPSPYDAMLFSREPLSIHVAPLLGRDAWRSLVGDVPWTTARHADHQGAFDRQYAALGALWRTRRDSWDRDVATFAERTPSGSSATRARSDAARAVSLRAVAGAPPARRAAQLDWRGSGLTLWGDLQIGISWRDRQALAPLFLDGYAMGAPPSRTNPEGQPWGYPVLDPAQYDGDAGALVIARMGKLIAEYDGLRVDHPHGLVDPWVYRTGAADPHQSVRAGARLFSSPDLPDHPRLGGFAIARDRAARSRRDALGRPLGARARRGAGRSLRARCSIAWSIARGRPAIARATCCARCCRPGPTRSGASWSARGWGGCA